RRKRANSPTGRLGIFQFSLHAPKARKSPNRQVGDLSVQPTRAESAQIPQPAGWGSFSSAYKARAHYPGKSPNRQVGDLSVQPTKHGHTIQANPPTGRLGIFQFSLQSTGTLSRQIPQPAGWGSFSSAYTRRKRANSPTGRLGIFQFSLHAPKARKSPNRQVGDLSVQPTRAESAQIPQPAGWGSFSSAYTRRKRANPPTGRLGIFQFSLQARTLSSVQVGHDCLCVSLRSD